jgi:SMODS and SLOG-associating 2TM effector domain family 4
MHEIIEAATKFRNSAQFMRDQHYGRSDNASRWNIILGVPATLIAAVVSTSIFASINSSPSNHWKIVAGTIALIAAALSALQTFFRFPESGERHRVAAAKYGAVRRSLELFVLRYAHANSSSRDEALNALDKLTTKLGELDESSPGIGKPRTLSRRRRAEPESDEAESADAAEQAVGAKKP